MEFGKPIPEADEVLEHSFLMPPHPSLPQQPKFSSFSLKGMARDVQNIINHFPYHRSQLPVTPQVSSNGAINQSSKTVEPLLPQNLIGKYNPIGQMYRFEQAEFQLQVSKAEIKLCSKSEKGVYYQPKQQTHKQFSMRDRESVMAEESLDNSQIKFPSHNYYIMFDRKSLPQQANPKVKEKVSRTVCLQRKVHNLQKEVKMLRGGTTSTAFRKSEGKMKLQRLLNSMIG